MKKTILAFGALALLGACSHPLTLATRHVASEAAARPDCSRQPTSLPDPSRPPGVPSAEIPIDHVIVLMEENHSFDNFFGRLNVSGYAPEELDGVTSNLSNTDDGATFPVFHQNTYCVENPAHSWDSVHLQYDEGRLNGFVKASGGGKRGARVMGYYEKDDLEYLYAMANRFAIADRYFSSLLGPTYPNRAFLYAATSFGHLRNNTRISADRLPLIFTRMSRYGVSWKYYRTDFSVALQMIRLTPELIGHFATVKEYYEDLASGTLPSVAFLETSELEGEEHPPFDLRAGQHQVANMINRLMESPLWPRSALFFTYDEHGGYYDHVVPPPACAPDEYGPILEPRSEKAASLTGTRLEARLENHDTTQAAFDRYGFRVPFLLVSPWAKRHFVSHATYDHTSMLKFIESKFNLPALTRRDANADAMLDLFDFASPPRLDYPTPPVPPKGDRTCAVRFHF